MAGGPAFEEQAKLEVIIDDKALEASLSKARMTVKKESEAIKKHLTAAVAVGASVGWFTKQAAQFQAGMAAIEKTTGMTGRELEKFGARLRKMSQESIFGAEQLQEIAAAAGQLGVTGTAALTKYTETIAMLGTASDLAGEEAAFALSRFMNTNNLLQEDVDRLGSSLVALGNAFATTEREAIETANAIAAKSSVYGLSAQAALGYAAALNSMGQGGEAAGMAFSKLLLRMTSARDKGGEEIKKFAEVMQMEVSDVVKLLEEDVDGAVQAYLQGLSRYGKESVRVLRENGIVEERAIARLASLAGNIELTKRAQDTANTSWEENTALMKEYETLVDTVSAQFDIFKNKMMDIARGIGMEFLPGARSALDALNEMFTAERIETAGKLLAEAIKLGAAFIAARLAVAGLRIAIVGAMAAKAAIKAMTATTGGLKVAFNLAKISAAAMWSAATLGLTLLIAYGPELWAWFTKAGGWFDKLKNKAALFGNFFKQAFLSVTTSVREGMLVLSPILEKLFGTEFVDGLRQGVAAAKSEMIDLVKTAKSLQAEAASLAAGTTQSVIPSSGLGTTAVGGGSGGGDGGGGGGSGGGGSGTALTGIAARRSSSTQFGPNPFNRRTSKEMMKQAIVNANREIELAEHEHNKALADDAAMWDHLKRQRALGEEAWEKEQRDRRFENELTALRMQAEGVDEQEIEFFERRKELEMERDELKRIADEERRRKELEINAAHFTALAKQEFEYNKEQLKKKRQQTVDLLNELGGRSKEAAKVVALAAKAQALIYLTGQAPVDASAAFGNAMRHIPAPFNLVAAPAAAAAVMARAIAAVDQAKSLEVPSFERGGMIPGGFSLRDNQLLAGKSGELVLPQKNIEDYNRGMKQRMMEEQDETEEPGAGRDITLQLRGDAGKIFEAATSEVDVLGV